MERIQNGKRIDNSKSPNKPKSIEAEEKRHRINNAIIILENSTACPFRWVRTTYLCYYCDHIFTDPILLRKHSFSEHDIGTSVQKKLAIKKVKQNKHVKLDISDLRCKQCDEVLNNLEHLWKHLCSTHKKDMNPKYNDILLPFRLKRVDVKEFLCAICSKKFEEFKVLSHHMNTHFRNFICEQCGAGFVTPDRLRSHSFSHETGSYPCQSCDKVFRSLNSRNEHYAVVHKLAKRHHCPHCPETFRNYFQRNKHQSSVHGVKIKEYKCKICDKVFTSSGKVGIHTRAVHMKLKRYACEMCEWKFYSKSELKDHMVRHTKERKYQCNVCNKAYARKHTLREHIRIHENDKRFVCVECGKAFIQNCSLRHHVKVHHLTANGKAYVSGT